MRDGSIPKGPPREDGPNKEKPKSGKQTEKKTQATEQEDKNDLEKQELRAMIIDEKL